MAGVSLRGFAYAATLLLARADERHAGIAAPFRERSLCYFSRQAGREYSFYVIYPDSASASILDSVQRTRAGGISAVGTGDVHGKPRTFRNRHGFIGNFRAGQNARTAAAAAALAAADPGVDRQHGSDRLVARTESDHAVEVAGFLSRI